MVQLIFLFDASCVKHDQQTLVFVFFYCVSPQEIIPPKQTHVA